MSEKKIVVPERMLKAVLDAYWAATEPTQEYPKYLLEAALRWLSENPIVPSTDQMEDIDEATDHIQPSSGDGYAKTRARCVEWQRRMFLAPEPEIPEEVKDLMGADSHSYGEQIDQIIIEAFRRGQKSR